MTVEGNAEERKGDWQHLGDELKRRTCEPFRYVPFVMYVFLAIVLFGGLGIWAEIVKLLMSGTTKADLSGIVTAITTYYPTLIGASCLQLVLSSVGVQDKVFIAFSLLVLCVSVSIAIVLTLLSGSMQILAIFGGVVLSMFAMWIWWITNADEPIFRPIPPIDSATGGNVDEELKGNLSGFEI